jgi:hypothetical protein
LTRIKPAAYPELRRVFAGYLHEDSLLEAGTPEAALRTFREDAGPAELRRFQREVKRLLAQVATLELDELRDLVGRLGGRWVPPSREALIALLTEAAESGDPSSR